MGFANNVVPWSLWNKWVEESKSSDKFPEFPKIPRWDRQVVITEKIDGTNGLVSVERASLGTSLGYGNLAAVIPDDSELGDDGLPSHEFIVRAGSRSRWLTTSQDNFGFAAWVRDNAQELVKLGSGRHYGEWYGRGINRGYELSDRRFMLFNVSKWADPTGRPSCCEVATVVTETTGSDLSKAAGQALGFLAKNGSMHVPGFKDPEGIVMYHTAGNHLYKTTLKNDDYETREGVAFPPMVDDFCGVAA